MQTINVNSMTPAERKAMLAELAKAEGVTVAPKKASKITVEPYTKKTGDKSTSVKGFIGLNGNDFNRLCVSQGHAEALLSAERMEKGYVMKWLQAIAGQQLTGCDAKTIA